MKTPAATVQPDRMTHREILEALSGLMLVLFVAMISSTIVSTALPRVLGELNGTQTQYTWAMFGASVFLGQYFQIGSGYTPTESGLLTIPMMAGVMIATTITGQLVTRTGKVK